MPWVRIDENIIDHPKFIALTPPAFWLWVEGLTYCQKHLTDGHVPRPVLRGMRHYSPSAMKLLSAVLVPNKGPLWHVDPNGDIRVHDYLEHNDSRETVLKKRKAAQERMGRSRSSACSREQASEHNQRDSANASRGVTVSDDPPLPQRREGGLGETTPPMRAGAFCEWYADTHSRLIGVGYIGNPRKDYEKALELVAVFDDQELQDAAMVWFGMEDDFATRGTRTIPKFASRATKCVELAREVAS